MQNTSAAQYTFPAMYFPSFHMESTDSKQDAQGHPRPGKQEYSPRKSTGCGAAASGDEAHSRHQKDRNRD